MKDNANEPLMEEGEEREEGELGEEPNKPKDMEQNLGFLKPFQIIA